MLMCFEERRNRRIHRQNHVHKSTAAKGRKVVSVAASVNGDIFLHCPIQFGEDVQVNPENLLFDIGSSRASQQFSKFNNIYVIL